MIIILYVLVVDILTQTAGTNEQDKYKYMCDTSTSNPVSSTAVGSSVGVIIIIVLGIITVVTILCMRRWCKQNKSKSLIAFPYP